MPEKYFIEKMKIHIETAKQTDLDDINHVIESAIMQWDLPRTGKTFITCQLFL